jgi:hypothetical protein
MEFIFIGRLVTNINLRGNLREKSSKNGCVSMKCISIGRLVTNTNLRGNLREKSSKNGCVSMKCISIGSLVANTNLRGNAKIIYSLVYAKWTIRSCNVG